MWTCKHCTQVFPYERTTEKANHTRWCESNPKVQIFREENQQRARDRAIIQFGPLTEFDVVCETCSEQFITEEREALFPVKEQYYCSRACANSVGGQAKARIHHPDEIAHYRTVCFRHHKKECVVCDEKNVVEVHHLDGNHNNNDPQNLVPLCPTHHRYWHSRFKPLIEHQVLEYSSNWKET